VLTRFDAYCTARALADLANTALSAVSESVLLYRMLAGGRLAPLMLAVWLVQALPALDSEENRLWTQGARRSHRAAAAAYPREQARRIIS
jgi:hypothetical protein